MPRTSSIGLAAAATCSREVVLVGERRDDEQRAPAPAEPNAARSSPRSRSTSSASEQTAITIALRGPTFMNVCAAPLGRHVDGDDQLVGLERVPLRTGEELAERQRARPAAALATSTSAPATSSGGSASPAGEAVPRLPPIVPRLRICGEPTVREASASAGRSVAKRPLIASV